MFIIKTLHGDVKADYDEIERIANAKETLVFLRNGAVNPKHITNIVKDTERMREVLKRPGESDADVQARIRQEKSEDIFKDIRGPALGQGPDQLKLL